MDIRDRELVDCNININVYFYTSKFWLLYVRKLYVVSLDVFCVGWMDWIFVGTISTCIHKYNIHMYMIFIFTWYPYVHIINVNKHGIHMYTIIMTSSVHVMLSWLSLRRYPIIVWMLKWLFQYLYMFVSSIES